MENYKKIYYFYTPPILHLHASLKVLNDNGTSNWNSQQIVIVLGFNDTSTLVGHFVSSPREREKREEIVEEMKERDRKERGIGMKMKKKKK